MFYSKAVLREYEDISDGIGVPSWQLTLTLFLSWMVTYLILIKGMQSLGRVAYFLAIFPYVILITLLIRAVTLEGAVDGIIFFLKPEWNKLLDTKVDTYVYTYNHIVLLHELINISEGGIGFVDCY